MGRKFYGTNGNDPITYWFDPDNIILGRNGDEFWGRAGDDDISGNHANNKLFGGPGDDYLMTQRGNDLIVGGPGFDIAIVQGIDLFLKSNDRSYDVKVDMNLQNRWQAISATKYNRGLKKIHSSIEGIQSGSGNDELIGNAQNNSLYSFHGDDFLFGGTGKDRLYGGEGEDTFKLAKGRGHAILHDYSYDDDWLYIDAPFSRLSVDYRRKDARIFDGNDMIAYVPGFAGATLQDYGDGYVALG